MGRSLIVMLVLAQAAVETPAGNWIDYFAKGGAFAVIVFVVWWLLTRTIPDQQKTFEDSMGRVMTDSAEQRRVFQEEMQRSREQVIEILRQK